MLKYYYLLIFCLCLGACSLTDSDAPIPSYLVVNDIDVFTTDNQGAPTHDITDIWVYADNQLLGVFEIPTRVPIIVNNEMTKIQIFPGFRNNGETSRSFIYNFFNPIEFTIPIAPGEEIERALTYSYKDEIIFDFVEGFESSEHIFTVELDGNAETSIEISNESSVEGSKSGKISLDNENNEIAVTSIFKYQRALNAGTDSYLEMDYKNDIPFFIGVIYVQEGSQVTQPLIVLNPKDDWNKIYIDFSEILTSPVLETYQVYFTADVEPLDQTTGEIFIDNLKFVHF